MRKISKYLLFIGIAMAVAGLVAGLIPNRWTLVPLSLLGVGLLLIILCLGVGLEDRFGFWRRRSTQAGTNAIAAVGSVLVMVGLINFLGTQWYVRWDFSAAQSFTLAPQSQALLQSLEQPLRVWVFSQQPQITTKNLLETYDRYGGDFQFQFVDPDFELPTAQRFQVNILPNQEAVYVEYGDRRELVATLYQEQVLQERDLSNAIARILEDDPPKVYFLQGHGEFPLDDSANGLGAAVETLESRGFLVEPLNLATVTAIPEDAQGIVIGAPTKPLLSGEVESLQAYLNQGKGLLILAEPDTDLGLDPLLEPWGVTLENALIIDASGQGDPLQLGPDTPLITQYGGHPITNNIGEALSFYPGARPIATEAREGVEAIALLTTNGQSWGETDLANLGTTLTLDPVTDFVGPLDFGVALTKTITPDGGEMAPDPEGENPAENGENPESTENQEGTVTARLVVFGDGTFAANQGFYQVVNGDIFINSVKWLVGEADDLLAISAKEPTARIFNLKPWQFWGSYGLALVILPLGGLAMAIASAWRKR